MGDSYQNLAWVPRSEPEPRLGASFENRASPECQALNQSIAWVPGTIPEPRLYARL